MSLATSRAVYTYPRNASERHNPTVATTDRCGPFSLRVSVAPSLKPWEVLLWECSIPIFDNAALVFVFNLMAL